MTTLTRSNNAFPALGSYVSWEATAGWTVVISGSPASPSPTLVILANTDGTFTAVIGEGFTFDGSNNAVTGTVSEVQRYDASGLVLLESITDLPVSYAVTDFQANIATGVGGTMTGADSLNGGTSSFDVLYGYAGADTFTPGALTPDANGVSFIDVVGGAGNDTFTVGASDPSTVIVAYTLEELYFPGGAGVTVDLSTDSATDTYGDTDTLTGITFVVATDKDDTLTGDTTDDFFAPGGGDDAIDGGDGYDQLLYTYVELFASDGFGYLNGITVTMSSVTDGSGTVLDPKGGLDTFDNIELVSGTRWDDVFNGGDFNDLFQGHQGADEFHGGLGDDMVDYAVDYIGGGVAGVTVDLSAGTATDVFGDVDTLDGIENIIGSRFNDTITGDSEDNYLDGVGGNDVLYGGDGSDILVGGGGWDWLAGGQGNDIFWGSLGGSGGLETIFDAVDYHLDGGIGAITVTVDDFGVATVIDTWGDTDTVNPMSIVGTDLGDIFNGSINTDSFAPGGGDDIVTSGGGGLIFGGDELFYSYDDLATVGIDLDLERVGTEIVTNDTVDNYWGTDTLIGFTSIWLEATQHDDILKGGSGDDALLGSLGTDELDGRDGFDAISYVDYRTIISGVGVTYNATGAGSGTVQDAGGSTDIYTNFELLAGSTNDDVFNGSAEDDNFLGHGGNDIFHGGDGIDTLYYVFDDILAAELDLPVGGVNISLDAGTGTDPYGDIDTFDGIENVVGSEFDDLIIGTFGANVLTGGGGGDTLSGGEGNDILWAAFEGGGPVSTFDTADYRFDGGSSGITVTVGASGVATVIDTYGTIDTVHVPSIFGTDTDDTFIGSINTDRFAPGAGDDTITSGGAGPVPGGDQVYYSADTASTVGIDLDMNRTAGEIVSMSGGYWGTDDLIGFTSIWIEGTEWDDILRTGAGDDVVLGSFGSDDLDGRGGFDAISYVDWRSIIYGVGVTYNATGAGTGTAVDGGGSTDTYVNFELLAGSMRDDVFNGSAGNDNFLGHGGADVFHGNGGSDTLYYAFDDLLGDNLFLFVTGVTVNLSNGTATDSFGDLDTFDGIENVIGSAFADDITGDNGVNVLDGGADGVVDVLKGLGGTDTYVLGSGNDTVVDTGGTDTITSTITRSLASFAAIEHLTLLGTSAINGTGNGSANTITGNSGNNTLDGGAGNDTLVGLGGNDIYIVATGDNITENAGQGTGDRARAAATFALASGDNIEFLETTNAALTTALNLTGNEVVQTITGNAGNNVLSGLGGNDTLVGNAGNDTLDGGIGNDVLTGGIGNDIYIVNTGDNINESSGQGTADRARAAATFVLATGDNIEFLETTNAALTTALSLTGNEIAQTITGNGGANTLSGLAGNDILVGNAGNDTLLGGLGNDTLTGGAGNDFFVFNTALNASTNRDSITDYNVAADTIRLENAIFTAIGQSSGTLAAARFFVGTAAHDADDRIIYNASTGALIYDSNGNAAGGAIQFATLTTHPGGLTNADFVII